MADKTKPTEKKLFLLDGMALVYRAHYSLIRSPRYTSRGVCTNAVFGLTNTVMDIMKKQEPSHIACVFDTPEPTHRHKEFPDYKANRDALPEELGAQFPLVERLMQSMNITTIRSPGWEADDIIGTLALEAEADGYQVYMVTPDKDYHQLVTPRSVIYKPGRQGSQFETLGVEEVLEHWGVERVSQVIDVLGLMGDTSDNIPGVPGIGPKTAQKLIAMWGSTEKLLKNVDCLKGKQKENVINNSELALLSKRLVTIATDVPHDIKFADLKVKPLNKAAMKELFVELEFDGLGKRIFGNSFSASSTRAAVQREIREVEIQKSLFGDEEPAAGKKKLADVKHNYTTVTTQPERAALLAKLLKEKTVCFDTETTGLDPRTATALGVSFSVKAHEAWYVVCPDDEQEAPKILAEFRELFENESIEKVGHNLKYDITLLAYADIEVRGPLMDTMLAHSMKEPEMRHGLDYLAGIYLNYEPIPTTDLIGEKGDDQKNMRDVPLERVAEYACEDADITLQVANILRPDIEKQGVADVCFNVECPLIPALVSMEKSGIRLDGEALKKYSEVLATDIAQLQESIYARAGKEFNIDSPKQLGIVLYDDLKLVEKPKKTATGQYSTRETELTKLAGKHKIVAEVLDYRTAAKLKSVYVDQLPTWIDEKTGRLHTHYSQNWTATGRLQSNNPNLQTIPVRKARGREIRAAFVPRDDNHLLLAADYSQIELRVMAELSGDEAMIEAFQTETDIHRLTASKVYKVELDDVTREMRDKAKTVNFGIIYGISPFGLQQRLNIPRHEAYDLIENYFEKYPAVQVWIDKTIAFGEEHGYVKTGTGRRRYIRNITSRNNGLKKAAQRLAMNSPIQGTAADMLKLAIIKVYHALRAGEFKTEMLLTVHDELVFDMPKDEADTVMPVIQEAMQTALPMNVPIKVELGTGTNWLEAH